MIGSSEGWSSKRKLYAIEEREESSPVTVGKAEADLAYDADVDELEQLDQPTGEREIIYELFQPWALSTYGDQAKTKTITLRKKARILKALEGKEHSRPDSSKFRFWVKTKGEWGEGGCNPKAILILVSLNRLYHPEMQTEVTIVRPSR